jgi:hypothetical protein
MVIAGISSKKNRSILSNPLKRLYKSYQNKVNKS